MEWFFDGLGTAIITLVIGLFVGGGVGYKFGSNKQKQKARNNSTQTQIGSINNINGKE